MHYGDCYYKAIATTSTPREFTVTLPSSSSTVTVKQYGVALTGAGVNVTDANLTYYLNSTTHNTNTLGKATFSVPVGSFRYLILDRTTNKVYGSSVLVVPYANHDITIVADEPNLVSPANNVSLTTSSLINFQWGTVTNATQYVLYLRHENSSDWNSYNFGNATSPNINFSLSWTGTWYWAVEAYNSSNELIGSSDVRSITISSPASNSSSNTNNSLISQAVVSKSPITTSSNIASILKSHRTIEKQEQYAKMISLSEIQLLDKENVPATFNLLESVQNEFNIIEPEIEENETFQLSNPPNEEILRIFRNVILGW
ncbi:MAG: hypothetical protein LBJ67_03645 [Planctomycetaceae bacterium]|jgi:hypothetical protein|nr:hypothetical protein [Planctomycetaceae bacterium]